MAKRTAKVAQSDDADVRTEQQARRRIAVTAPMLSAMAQIPYNLGDFGVEIVWKLIKGGILDAVIDTGTVLVDTLNAADFQ